MDCDVLIVGAGPAGVSAARGLAGSGLDVVVAERLSDQMMGRYHAVCGEAVSDRMLRRCRVDPSVQVARVGSIRIGTPGGVSLEVPVGGWIVDRPAMIGSIRGECDARFIRATVASVARDGDGFTARAGDLEIRCGYIIGADGAHSVVRRDLFGTSPRGMLPVVNTISPGDGGGVLDFTVSAEYGGFYAWRFPSKDGTVSVGFPKGFPEPDGTTVRGGRHLPFGGVPEAVSGNALLVGDAAGLANALCYGGIGAAMESGARAARAVRSGRPRSYGRWYRRCIYRDPRFMRAHEEFSGWSDGDIADAMEPFRNGYSLWNGLRAMVRRPRRAGVYMAVFIAFRYGW